MRECDGIPYEVDLKGFEDRIKKASRILVQAPDGLKIYLDKVVECIKSINASATVYADASPLYGACDLHVELVYAIKADLVIHLGHNEYPIRLGGHEDIKPLREKVVYVPAYSKVVPEEEVVVNLAKEMRSRGFSKTSLTAVIQHAKNVSYVKRILEESGITVIVPRPAYSEMYRGQILGCEYSAINVVDKMVDVHIVISGGMFHALGASLSSTKPVYKLDPYRQEYIDITPFREKYLRKRLYKVMKAMDAAGYGIIVGSKTGQYREWIVRRLEKILSKHQKRYTLYITDILNAQILGNIDNENIDAFIVTSCPRLPIDDLDDYPKPVLTPGEAVMAITGRIKRYVFPW